MLTSLTRTGLKTDPRPEVRSGGFTLLELLVIMLIVGTLTGIGAGLFSMERNHLEEGARQIEAAVAMARNSAMLRNKPVYLELRPGGLEVREQKEAVKGSKDGRQELPSGVSISAVNGRPFSGTQDAVLCFHPRGVTSERVIWLRDGLRELSMYIPAVGSPFMLNGSVSLEQMRKEYL